MRYFAALLLILSTTLFSQEEVRKSPDSEVAEAALWLSKTPERNAASLRFISLYSSQEESVRKDLKTGEEVVYSPLREDNANLIWVVNQLNRRNTTTAFEKVSSTLYAVDLASPGWDAASWEFLAGKSSYFHPDWVTHQNWNYLVSRCGSSVPIIRGDEFAAKATVNNDYYNFLFGFDQVKTLADLKKLYGVNTDLLYESRAIRSAIVNKNLTVTRHNRRLEHWPGIIPFWVSYDTVANSGRKNALSQYGGQHITKDHKQDPNDPHDFDFDGQEIIIPLRNGGFAGWINDKQGNRLTEVPITIAPGEDAFLDRTVRAGRSCFGCHQAMVKEFRCNLHELVSAGFDIFNSNQDYAEVLKSAYDQYDMQRRVLIAQEEYRDNLKRYLGIDAQTARDEFVRSWKRYDEEFVDLKTAARECGLTEEKLVELVTANDEPAIKELLTPGGSLARDAWEGLFAEIMTLNKIRVSQEKIVEQKLAEQVKKEEAVMEQQAKPKIIEVPKADSEQVEVKLTFLKVLKTYKSDKQASISLGQGTKIETGWEYPVTVKKQDGVWPKWIDFTSEESTERYEVLEK